MPKIRALKSLLLALWAIVLVGTLTTGCDAKEATPPAAEENEIGLQVEGLNYSGVPIGVFYVNDQWAGNVGMYAGGRSVATSIGLPKVWRPGLKVTIKWRNDVLYAKDPQGLYTHVLEIPPYGDMLQGSLWVAFLPNDQIQIYASNYGPGHLQFPNRDLINPRDYCLIRPACHDKYYPQARVPELWEVYSPFRLSDPPTEQERQEAMRQSPELKELSLKP
ncbi:hypothetical protein CKY39_31690 [Variovorax boronicumulans]|uniref:DUF3304 domain-containing protein n=1 Tax=Variovorax boronicumulans TaxID=436515 RepID=A0A250DSR2_9BURK|nr:DUF3304 domain-containing protein [Variovorax boronicumulans]ATA57282.1 hypothetical protein CKY39_31690 [Variovorax boronicumulans]